MNLTVRFSLPVLTLQAVVHCTMQTGLRTPLA